MKMVAALTAQVREELREYRGSGLRWWQWLRSKLTGVTLRRLGRLLVLVLPWLVIAVFSYWYVRLGVLREIHLDHGLDLGTYTQLLHNIANGQWPPYNTLKGQVAWGDHAHFIMVLFAPLYWLWPSPLLPVVIQALAITTSAWALYRIAQHHLRNYFFSYALLLSYLLFFGVQYALDFDFHPSVLTAAILAWSLYALTFKRWGLWWITLLLGMLTREDAATFYFMIGAYLLLFHWRKRKVLALSTLAVATTYFLVVNYVIMPRWTPGGTVLGYFDIDGRRNPLAMVWWMVTNLETIWQNMTDSDLKVRSMRHLFQSFGWLPLASPFTYLAAAPNLIVRFASPEIIRHDVKLHYSASLVSVLSYGAILGTVLIASVLSLVTRLPRQWSRWGVSTVAGVALLIGTYHSSWKDPDLPLHLLRFDRFVERRYQPRMSLPQLKVVQELIPANATVSATSALVPQLSKRKKIYNFPDQGPEDKADWLVLTDNSNTWPLPKGEMRNAIKDFKEDDDFELVWDRYEIVVFKRK